ncbi:hypothetical protein AusDCA_1876 [Desulfitobacterium sp. AusDCA]
MPGKKAMIVIYAPPEWLEVVSDEDYNKLK